MKIMWVLFCLVLCPLAISALRSHQLEEQLRYDVFTRELERECEKQTPNCNDCLSKSHCSWCSDGTTAKCTSILQCPKESTFSQCNELKPVLDTRNKDMTDFLTYFESPPSFGNISRVKSCSERGNCSFCTSSGSCSWCEKKRKCFPFHGSSNATDLCGSSLWYRNQCLYKANIKPCPERTGGCKECTKDKLCYWCKSSGNCSYYPHDAYVPPECPADNWYYTSCTHMSFWVVMGPVLAIILTPVLIFIVLGIVLWCMKKCGYSDDEAEEADESADESPPPPEKKLTMSHKPEPSRVEELRKKYNLGD